MSQRMADCHPDRPHKARGLCASCYVRDWQVRNPQANSGNGWLRRHPEERREHNRRGHLKERHGTPLEVYVALWHEQEGRCANPRCRAEYPLRLEDHRKGLHVDHDHATGKLRRLLCPGCNVALGQVNDSVERLLGLVEYLEQFA